MHEKNKIYLISVAVRTFPHQGLARGKIEASIWHEKEGG